jgi:hypothetical protein
MRKPSILQASGCFLLVYILLSISACNGKPSPSTVQTAVSATLARMPVPQAEATRLVEVTQVMEVTKLVEVKITSTSKPAEKASATPSATATAETPTEANAGATGGEAATATETPQPVVPSGPLGLSFNQLMHQYADMTDLQKQQFAATLPGKMVDWTGQVYNITTEGVLVLDNPFGPGRVTVVGVPVEQAMKIDKGMLVDFTGMIASFEGSFLTEIGVVDAKITRTYELPTATPKQGRP